ncbi:MAG: trypsin-like peptidase domain-containing protein [Bacillota bacterium]
MVTGLAFYVLPIKNSTANQSAVGIQPGQAGTSFIADIVERTSPAVVMIKTTIESNQSDNPFFNDPFFRQFFGGRVPGTPRVSEGMGSGFIISKDGYILTNEHVINSASTIEVYMSGKNDPIPAKLVGSDYDLDLAVLKINGGDDLPTLDLGDSDAVRVGDWAIAIGNPQGLDHTVTVGVISAKGRPITIENKQYKNLLQTDASINPGNSGGPLLNDKGQVIGINTAVNASAQGIGFAIPTSTVRPVLDTLINQGKITRPWLGVYIKTVDKSVADNMHLGVSEGVLVASVIEGGPAARAGIRQGDVITGIDGNKIASADDLTSLVEKMQPGQQSAVVVNRGGKNLTIEVTIGEKGKTE